MASPHVWLVHTPIEIADIVENKGVVAIGWEATGDLGRFKTRDQMKAQFRKAYGNLSDTKTAVGAGTLYRFTTEIKVGDIILTPLKVSREVLMGTVTSEYIHDTNIVSKHYPNIRKTEWSKKVSRDDLSQPFRNTIGGILTVFNIDSHIEEVRKLLAGKGLEALKEEKTASEPPFYEQVQSQADEMISDLLSQIDPYDFQRFVAGLLKAIGFNVQLGPPGPDGGVDIDAFPDVFGFQSPRIKVQVKHRKGTASAPEIQQLAGAAGNNEALFISTGGFTSQASKEAEKHSKLALLNRDKFIDLLLEHYEKLDPEYQALVPLKKIYVPIV